MRADRWSIRLILGTCLVAALILIATAIEPSLDIELARFARLQPASPLAELLGALRPWTRYAPSCLLGALVVVEILRVQQRRTSRRVALKRIGFLAGAFILAPGLLVNGLLKSHSHRPRPSQTIEVANAGAPFRPFTAFDGACQTNCSFSSGETASAFWTMAPALLAPPALRLPAVAAALAFGAAVGAMRIGMGAHYLSDVAFSALSTLLIVVAGRLLLDRSERSGAGLGRNGG